jgi:hypothetical protein
MAKEGKNKKGTQWEDVKKASAKKKAKKEEAKEQAKQKDTLMKASARKMAKKEEAKRHLYIYICIQKVVLSLASLHVVHARSQE